MLRFVVRRLLLLPLILLGLSVLVFAWIRALPGNPAEALLGERATAQNVAAVKQAYGLNQSLPQQYWSFLSHAVRLDFGNSIYTHRSVSYEIQHRFPATIELTVAALIFAVGIGIPLGYFAARRYQTWLDNASVVGSLLGISIPVFFLAYLLKYLFAVKLHWLPSIGRLSPTTDIAHPTNFYTLDALLDGNGSAFIDAVKHLILPGISLGTIPLAIITRITRAAVLDVVNEDYVRTAEAKGLTQRVIRGRHILHNAMLPVSTVIGLQTGLLLSGAVLTETVYAWNGMGSFLAQAIFQRDYPVLEGGILFVAVVFVLVNLLVDISYGFIDPRVRVR